MQLGNRLDLIGRKARLFESDLRLYRETFAEEVSENRFLVVGGAGSIGSTVVKELFCRNPRTLHVIDSSENSLAELVRDIRSSFGYNSADFQAFCFDAFSRDLDALKRRSISRDGGYDYILNFAALKHVRSEKDPLTLMRLVDINIFLPRRLLRFAQDVNAKKFFCVSTDKAANPASMMGGSKRIMEMFLRAECQDTSVSTSRFANVSFSDGSLPHSWTQRIRKKQPISAPSDIRRYFITEQESAQLCLFSILQGNDGDIYFPKLVPQLHLTTFESIARRFLKDLGWDAHACESEDAARSCIQQLNLVGKWPCYFFHSDTTGEKGVEEFFTADELVDWNRYAEIGIVKNMFLADANAMSSFTEHFERLRNISEWTREDIKSGFQMLLPHFQHLETGKFLDSRM